MYLRILSFLLVCAGLLASAGQSYAHRASTVAPAAAPAELNQAAQAALSPPTWIYIASIELSQPIVPVGVDINGVPIVPDHNPGWFNQSARPGEGENIVLWGHVLRFQSTPHIPAPFGRIKELAIGTPIHIFTADGQEHVYIVQQQIWVQPTQVEYILPVGAERLTLVSCIGEYVIVDGSVENMSHRLITIATPAQ